MVRLVSGRMGPKRKGAAHKLSKKERKALDPWVVLTDIKNETGLSFKSLHIILGGMNLWIGKTPSRFAVSTGIVRYNRHRGAYEWRKRQTIGEIKDYVQNGSGQKN